MTNQTKVTLGLQIVTKRHGACLGKCVGVLCFEAAVAAAAAPPAIPNMAPTPFTPPALFASIAALLPSATAAAAAPLLAADTTALAF